MSNSLCHKLLVNGDIGAKEKLGAKLISNKRIWYDSNKHTDANVSEGSKENNIMKKKSNNISK